MRIIYFAIGVLGVAAPVLAAILSPPSKSDFWSMSFAGGAIVVAGILHLLAGIKNYRGHWSFVVGMVLLVGAFAGLGLELDDYVANKSEDFGLGLVMVVIVSILGSLSLWSGHKLHRCVIKLESGGRYGA